MTWLRTTSQRLATLTLGTLTWLRTTSRRLVTLTLGTQTWLRTTSRRPAMFTLGTPNWLSDRGSWVLGGLACLALALPSAPRQFRSSADTSAHRDVAVAAAPAVEIPTVVAKNASSPKVSARAARSTRAVAQPPVARSSSTVKSKELPKTPPVAAVIVGTLFITSTPAGANVFMNQRHVGKTPLETSVKAGSYAVLVELEGARWTDVVLVRADRVTRLEPQLIPRR